MVSCMVRTESHANFCDVASFRRAQVFIENDLCFFASQVTPVNGTLPGSGLVIPRAHRDSPFELTPDEWLSTRSLLLEAKSLVDQRLRPDGYNLIWNVGADAGQEVAHAHLHIVPRFHDEPYAGKGARWWLKQGENRRPDPAAPGLGRVIRSWP